MPLPIPIIPNKYLTLMVNIVCRIFTCDHSYPYPEINYDSLDSFILNDIEASFFDVNSAPEPNIVSVDQGDLEGYYMTTSGGRKIGAFEGIEYGRAERWSPPKPARPWRGVLEAKSPGPDCMQFNIRNNLQIYGNEECLYLNIYTPVISGEKSMANLPVVIYIHGGSFLFGAGRENGPSYLLNEDIILVTINYRLGILGFMSTGDRVLPGNYGLKDQVLAIRYIKDNIKAFGGNPDDITLWGYSAGAASVHLHFMSNQTKDLFSRGISHGGNAFSHWGVYQPKRIRSLTDTIARHFKCPLKNTKAMVNCLRDIDPLALVSSQVHLEKWIPFPPVTFTPTIEYDLDEKDVSSAFLIDSPSELYRTGQVAKKPFILTTTKDEGISIVIFFELIQRWSITKLYWRRVAKHVLDLDYMKLKNVQKLVDKITRFYFGKKLSSQASAHDYSDMLTDRYFHFAVYKSLQAHSAIAPTYSYLFAYHNGTHSIGDLSFHKSYEWGAGHGEDEYYFFNCTKLYPSFKTSDPEYKISKVMLNLISNFIIDGVPKSSLPQEDILWEPVTNPNKVSTLLVDGDFKMVTPSTKRIKFWQNLNLPDTKLWIPL